MHGPDGGADRHLRHPGVVAGRGGADGARMRRLRGQRRGRAHPAQQGDEEHLQQVGRKTNIFFGGCSFFMLVVLLYFAILFVAFFDIMHADIWTMQVHKRLKESTTWQYNFIVVHCNNVICITALVCHSMQNDLT